MKKIAITLTVLISATNAFCIKYTSTDFTIPKAKIENAKKVLKAELKKDPNWITDLFKYQIKPNHVRFEGYRDRQKNIGVITLQKGTELVYNPIFIIDKKRKMVTEITLQVRSFEKDPLTRKLDIILEKSDLKKPSVQKLISKVKNAYRDKTFYW